MCNVNFRIKEGHSGHAGNRTERCFRERWRARAGPAGRAVRRAYWEPLARLLTGTGALAGILSSRAENYPTTAEREPAVAGRTRLSVASLQRREAPRIIQQPGKTAKAAHRDRDDRFSTLATLCQCGDIRTMDARCQKEPRALGVKGAGPSRARVLRSAAPARELVEFQGAATGR
jgi:hypothetical protein